MRCCRAVRSGRATELRVTGIRCTCGPALLRQVRCGLPSLQGLAPAPRVVSDGARVFNVAFMAAQSEAAAQAVARRPRQVRASTSRFQKLGGTRVHDH